MLSWCKDLQSLDNQSHSEWGCYRGGEGGGEVREWGEVREGENVKRIISPQHTNIPQELPHPDQTALLNLSPQREGVWPEEGVESQKGGWVSQGAVGWNKTPSWW